MISFYLVSHINKNKLKVTEGELRCDELASYLDKVGTHKTVWLSEDGSGIVAKVCYDSSSNQMVGLILPIDSTTSMPIPFSFTPKSMKDLEEFSQKHKFTSMTTISSALILCNDAMWS